MHHPGTNNKVYKKINDNFEWSSENFKKISEIFHFFKLPQFILISPHLHGKKGIPTHI